LKSPRVQNYILLPDLKLSPTHHFGSYPQLAYHIHKAEISLLKTHSYKTPQIFSQA
jgi:hypothetical protein